jgi:hypothetical protein
MAGWLHLDTADLRDDDVLAGWVDDDGCHL